MNRLSCFGLLVYAGKNCFYLPSIVWVVTNNGYKLGTKNHSVKINQKNMQQNLNIRNNLKQISKKQFHQKINAS
jgi:hypothetical protein